MPDTGRGGVLQMVPPCWGIEHAVPGDLGRDEECFSITSFCARPGAAAGTAGADGGAGRGGAGGAGAKPSRKERLRARREQRAAARAAGSDDEGPAAGAGFQVRTVRTP
jgi:hypothetical protein